MLKSGRAASLLLVLVAGLVSGTGRLAMAQSFDDVSKVISVTPVAGWRAGPDRHIAGLRIALAPGWKTYWRSGGSAGIAPRMRWDGSVNVMAVAPAWPAPGLFRQGGDLSIGYDADFTVPLVIETGAGAARLRGTLDLGVCADVCLPAQVSVETDLPPGGAEDAELVAALAAGPRLSSRRADCVTRPTPDGTALIGAFDLPGLGGSEAVVFELPDPALWVTDAVVSRSGDRVTAASEVMASGGAAVALDTARVRITVIGARGAVELAGCAP